MSVDKVILRAALSTLAAIGTLLVFIIVGLCALFPSTMMGITYDLGMESSSIHFAERAYKNSDDVYFIAYATEVAIQDENFEKIVSCGERFIADEEFESYCGTKNEGYEQFIYGQVCVSKYKRGAKDEAIELACDSLDGKFPKYNALIAVLAVSLEEEDVETVDKIRQRLQTLVVEGEDAAYLNATLDILNK